MSGTLVEIIVLALILILLNTSVGKRWFRILLVKVLPQSKIEEIGRNAVAKQPDEIHLVKADGGAWRNPEEAKRLASAFSERGFVAAGTYKITELPDVTLGFLVNTPASAYAIVYEHTKVTGLWCEIVSRYQDGRGVTFSSSRAPQMEQRPGHTVVRAPGFTPGALWARFQAERPQGDFVTLTADNLVELFEMVWRESIAFRKGRGGASREEIERVARWKR